MLALALLPPAIAGLGLGPWIERRLGGPRSIAIGLAAGAVAMAIADTLADGEAGGARGCEQADAIDGLMLGLAQATALAPGVSRERSHADGRPRPRLRSRSRTGALLGRGPAGDPRSEHREGRRSPRCCPWATGGVSRRGGGGVRLDAGERTGPARRGWRSGRAGAAALLGLPLPAGGRRAHPDAALTIDGDDRARHADRRALPARRGDRAGRHVDRLPCLRHRPRTPRRDQADAPRDRR